MAVYNPVEVKVHLKKIEGPNGVYYIGNCDMDISMLDTVIKFYPPKEGEKSGALIINNTKDRRPEEDDTD